MRFRLNMNGNSADDLKQQFDTLQRLTLAAIRHMETMDVTHGRNYQTLQNADAHREADRMEVVAMRKKLEDVRGWAMSGYAQVVRQREGL